MTLRVDTVTVYSVGLLGGSLGLALKSSGFAGRIIGLSSKKNRAAALGLGCIDEGHAYEDLPEVVRRTDVLFLCSPVCAILQTIRSLGALDLPAGMVVTDVGSTKGRIVSEGRACLPGRVHFIGGHPMAGSEKSGPAEADPFLFQNAAYALVPAAARPSPVEEEFAAFLDRMLGCRHLFMDAETHDAVAATVSHLPYLAAVALVNLAARTDTRLPGTLSLAAGGFRDMTRVASAPYGMWRDIFATNAGPAAAALDDYVAALRDLSVRLAEGRLVEAFEAAARTRESIPATGKGFIARLHEVLVSAKDRPGVIAGIAQPLARENINIKDIEIVKIREGEGGTIRLGFESPEVMHKALGILRRNGFAARER